MTNFLWPAQDGEQELHHIETTADGVRDSTGAFVRTTWTWNSGAPHLLNVRAKIEGEMHEQPLTVSTLARWVEFEIHGYAKVHIDGIRVVVPVDYLIVLLRQIERFNSMDSA